MILKSTLAKVMHLSKLPGIQGDIKPILTCKITYEFDNSDAIIVFSLYTYIAICYWLVVLRSFFKEYIYTYVPVHIGILSKIKSLKVMFASTYILMTFTSTGIYMFCLIFYSKVISYTNNKISSFNKHVKFSINGKNNIFIQANTIQKLTLQSWASMLDGNEFHFGSIWSVFHKKYYWNQENYFNKWYI